MAETGPIEEILDPGQAICDAHHHLWDLPTQRYLHGDFLKDAGSGHRVTHSVYVEWRSHYRTTGPDAMRPVGETEFAARAAQLTKSGATHVCAAIVGFADLSLGSAVAEVLDAHQAAGQGYFRGIRHVGVWDADAVVRGGPAVAPPGLYRDPNFRSGLAELQARGLSFDAWVYQTQLDDLIDLLGRCPDLPVVLNHTGGVLGIGPYAGRRDALFADWHSKIRRLSAFPNLTLKLGGLGMQRAGFPFYGQSDGVGSETVAAAWRPWFEAAIEAFGADRCMFESNFPVDHMSCSYAVLWNAFKRIVAALPLRDKDALFHATAARFYRIR